MRQSDINSERDAKDSALPRGLTPRRLAAIVAGDIAGLSRLMDRNAEGINARVKLIQRELIEPSITEHDGRLLKAIGNGFIAIFDSPLEAVRCSIVIQQNMSQWNMSLPRDEWIEYRIGINLGDVIIEEDDVYGEGFNVEFCLESIADPGEIYISGDIYEQIKHSLACRYELLGDRQVKDIADPTSVYRVLPDSTAASKGRSQRENAKIILLSFGLLVIVGVALWYTPQQPFEKTRTRDHNSTTVPLQMPHAFPSRLGAGSQLSQSPQPSSSAKAVTQVPALQTQPAASAVPGSKQAALETAPASPVAAASAANQVALQTAPASPAAPAPATKQTALETAPVPPAAAAPAANQAGLETAPASPPAAPASATKQAALQTAPASPAAAPVREPEMNMLQGGTFMMGSNDDATEKPIHRVTLKPFAISRYPISVREWNQCAAAKVCGFVANGKDDAPVTNVSWSDAEQFVTWLAGATHRPYRLPSETEWEYAARGGTQTKYWWGNRFEPGLANCKGCADIAVAQQPMKVGSFKPNPFGLYDMGGSVDQWVEDCWHRNYHGAPSDGSPWIESDCTSHVIRSGSWQNDSRYVRPSNRDSYDTNVRYPTHGFRVALSLLEGFR